MENMDREAGRLTLDTRKKVLLFAAIFLAAAFLLGCALCVFQLKTLDSGGKPRIVCIGDSLTFGSGVRETRDQDAWPAVLERELGGQYEVLNYGISGTVVQVGGDKPYDATMWEAAKKQHAEIYLFMLGSNDTKPQNWNRDGLAFQLGQMVKDLKKVPGVKTVYLMVPTPGYKLNEGDRYGIYNIDVDLINTELPPLFREDGGHGMLFRDKAGRTLLTLHRPNRHLEEHPVFIPLEEAGSGQFCISGIPPV